MARDTHIYAEVNSKTTLRRSSLAIRREVEDAGSRPALTEFYKRRVISSRSRGGDVGSPT